MWWIWNKQLLQENPQTKTKTLQGLQEQAQLSVRSLFLFCFFPSWLTIGSKMKVLFYTSSDTMDRHCVGVWSGAFHVR